MPTAVVTGATAGLGLGFAEHLARHGLDIVLVARDADRLAEVAEDLTTRFGVACEPLAADLADREGLDRVCARLSDPQRPVLALVNNAGFGLREPFTGTSIEDEQRMLDVLVTSVLHTTHAVVPSMVDAGAGWIINVSSIAGWFPGGTYSAAKAWVTTFSESLAVRLTGTGVRVLAVCPGFVRTEFHDRAGMDMSQTPDWMWLDVPTVVNRAFRDLAAGRTVSVAGPQYRPAARVLQHGPRGFVRRFAGKRDVISRRGE